MARTMHLNPEHSNPDANLAEEISSHEEWDAAELVAFRKRLRRWFRKNARDLPWRRTATPYAVWVSEIMLQQTQVATVIPYFERFLAAFPTISSLADAAEQDVLRQWEGLGYYRRARQLHHAAQQLVERFEGNFPATFDEVRSLPGIGRYTAGAILSIAHQQAHPILEGNTVRLHARLLNFHGDTKSNDGQRTLWRFAEQLVTRHQPGELNQALMELGSQVCTPKQPQCQSCPVTLHCRAFAANQVEALPRTKKTMQYEDRHEVAVIISSHGHYLMRQYGVEDRWAGLWDFCRFAAPQAPSSGSTRSPRSSSIDHRLIDEEASRQTGFTVRIDEQILQLKHAVTRFRIRLDCFRASIEEHVSPNRDPVCVDVKNPPKGLGRKTSDGAAHQKKMNWAWIPRGELSKLPLSVTGRKISNHLQGVGDPR